MALGNDSAESVPKSTAQLNQEQIEQANKLHEEATNLFQSEKIEQAIEKEVQAKKLAPGYWLPHAALACLYFGGGSIRGKRTIQEAADAVQTSHPWFADINLGLILQYFQLYDLSIEAFKRVPATAQQFDLAKAGIAISLIEGNKKDEGRKLLDEVYAAAPDNATLLEAVARGYADLGDLTRTKQICQKALSISQSEKMSELLRKTLIIAATSTSDVSLFDSLKDKASAELRPYERNWLKSEEFKFATSPRQGLSILRFAEADSNNITNQDWLSFASTLHTKAASAGTDSAGWLQLERDCLKHVEATEPNNVEVRIMLASIEEKLGQEQSALQKITEGWDSTPIESSARVMRANDQQAKADVTSLANAFFKEGKRYRSSIAEIECGMPKITCHCRYTHFKQAVLGLPGVISVTIGQGTHPTCLVVFDSRIASKDSILKSKSVAALHEQIDIQREQPVETISQLGDLTAKFVTPIHVPVFGSEEVALQFPSTNDEQQSNPIVSIGQSKTSRAN